MKWFLYIFLLLVILGCKQENLHPGSPPEKGYALSIPIGFSHPNIPENNTLTNDRVELGRRLFFDPLLSEDQTISCASCHQPQFAFADNQIISGGVGGALGLRNSPSLANVAYQERLFAEGGILSLELQAVSPLTEPHEMNMTLDEVISRLQTNEFYVTAFQKAYDTPPTKDNLTKVLAAFQRTLISGNSPFDAYYFRGVSDALTEAQKRGMELFFSERTQCSHCHSGFLFTDQSFANIGLYENYEDVGRARLTADPGDVGKFKVPSLRNIAVTAPYMHNGSISTLEEVIKHFNSGGAGHPNQHEAVKPLGLTPQECDDLVLFLESLTDQSFLQNPDYQ